MKPPKRKRIVLGIDDRIPSMIAASILRNQDFDLVGVHLRIDLGDEESLYPSALHRSDLSKIEKACSGLGIPLKIIDATEQALALVHEPLWIATLQGRTEAPSVRWLRDVLLPNLFKLADQFGAEGVATGHFAARMKRMIRYPEVSLDQSLAFATVPPEMLERLVLPLGEVSPDMVVRLARELGNIAKDERDYDGVRGLKALHRDRDERGNWKWERDVLKNPKVQARAEGDFFKAGPIRSVEEFSLGDHDGIPFYPYGSPAPGHEGQFVIEIQPQSRTIIVGHESHLLSSGVYLKDLNWTDGGKHTYRQHRARVRSSREGAHETVAGIFEYPGRLAELVFDAPLSRISVGETLIFLEESQVLGSGVVAATQLTDVAQKAIEKVRESE